ncbi:hypothetical protein MICA_1795 [Micavibrio aeruginosavorus ARL-13]|uniref:Uncharacterized protein n=1 Tax=Micavibrio aeruginosavorus (strain ARL-13) TaxID=856793 RepID=G2KSW1_MICAA|nr:hypothetical protein MICA_1795 [Micavibrio aeruginosavorus ARL-13]
MCIYGPSPFGGPTLFNFANPRRIFGGDFFNLRVRIAIYFLSFRV